MNDYMQALYYRFFQEPEDTEEKRQTELAERDLEELLTREQRKKLNTLLNDQSLWQNQVSFASFTAGFKLAWGIAKELEQDGLYSFREEMEQYFWQRVKRGEE